MILVSGKNQSLFISNANATKYLQNGCQGYLASVVETPKEPKDVNPSFVRTVSKFLDNFPKELSELPLEREFGFSIYLLPKTTRILFDGGLD